MGTEDWIFKGTELIANTKKKDYKSRVEVRLSKNTVLKKEQNHQSYKKNMKFALKIGSFFCKVIIGFKHEN